MILKLTFPSLFIYFYPKSHYNFQGIQLEEGGQTEDRYIKQDHTEFIVTGLRINPGCTVHTTRHVIPKLGPSVYFFPYCLNCLDLVIVKPQVKDTRHCLAGFFFFYSQHMHPPSGRVRYAAVRQGGLENIEALLSHYSHPWQPSYPLIVFPSR